MANHLYGYDVPYGGPGLYGPRSAASAFESSLGDGMRYHRSGDFPSGGYGSGRVWGGAPPWSVMDGLSSSVEPPVPGVKRPAEAAYHSAILGTHSAYGQSEALFATNPFAKRIRYESTSNLPMYPQRPGEKDCAHYMLTRACKFGDSCKFDHPLWVPEGGIPDWKEVPAIPSTEPLPEKPGEPDCPYFLKTQRCKFGPRCKFNHPKEKVQYLSNNADGVPGNMDISVLPERPSESACAYYMKTGKCKFGAMCKFHHPKDIELPPPQDNPTEEQNGLAIHDKVTTAAKPFVPVAPAMLHNSKGLPLRPGEADCPFYLKTGSCKYGATCRFNHPDRNSINPPVASALGKTLLASPAASLPFGDIGLSAQLFPNINSRITRTTGSQSLLEHGMGPTPTVYPQRTGQTECDFYMKTGECKFGERCKFHHPIDRTAPTQSMLKQTPQVKLTLAGLPRREDAIICPFYMKTGTCKYGATCRYDHPPPGEAIAKATVKGGPASAAGDTTTGEATTAERRDANAQ